MNYTNKDFYARISRIENLNFSVRREAELHLAQQGNVTKSADGRENPAREQLHTIAGYNGNIPFASANSRTKSTLTRNAGSGIDNSNMNNTTDTSENSFVIVAITEGRGHAEGEIGLAAMDINSPSLILSQISDAFWYRDILLKIEILCPSEIIVPLTVYNSGTKLMDEIKTFFPNTTITPIPRRYFSDSQVFNTLQTLCTSNCKNILNVINKKYYAMSAAAGLLAYVKNVLVINFLQNSLRIEYQNRSSRVFIDYECYHRLELLYSLAETKEKRCCLYGFLNNTVTAVGARCLRAFILEPYCETSEIYDMQNCIKEFLSDQNSLFATQECLKKFGCCDQLLKLCVLPPEDEKIKSIEIMINRVLLLKSTLENIPELRNCLKNFKSDSLQKLVNVLNDERFDIMLNEIKNVIQPEINSVKSTAQCFQRIYAIKPGICEYLDFMRDIYTSLVEQMRSAVSDAATRFGLPLRLIYSVAKGFHMQLTSTNKSLVTSIPAGLDTIYQKGNNYYLTNSALYKLNVRMSDVIDELHLASYRVARNLVEILLSNADASYELIGAVSSIDIILSLAKVSSKDGYYCPNFLSETRIVDAIYPFLEFTSSKPIPVPNNIIGTPEYNFYIITGPNMGGKTLYIKTIGIIQIMAQMGCYVPAKEATFRICDRIFTRIGFEDRVEKDSSSYVKEMKEFEYIFANITPNSLILIDEICRNTNPEEGKLIAFKICQSLAGIYGVHQSNSEKMADPKNFKEKVKLSEFTAPFIYLTTHFLELTKLTENYLNISNLFLHADETILEDKLHLTYTHKVMEGVTPIRGYGLALARTIRFPRKILQRAEEIYERLLISEKNAYLKQNASVSTSAHRFLPLLDESLKNPTRSTQSSVNTRSSKTVAGFLNKTVSNISETTRILSNEQNHESGFAAELYDIFAQMMYAFRSPSQNFSESCDELIKSFFERQPQELLDAIRNMDAADFKGLMPPEMSSPSSSSTSVLKDSQTTDLLDLSYHSLVRRFDCPSNISCFGSPNSKETQFLSPNLCSGVSLDSSLTSGLPNQTPIVQTCPSYLFQIPQDSIRYSNLGYHTFPGTSRQLIQTSLNFTQDRIIDKVDDTLGVNTAPQHVSVNDRYDMNQRKFKTSLLSSSTSFISTTTTSKAKQERVCIKRKSKAQTVWERE